MRLSARTFVPAALVALLAACSHDPTAAPAGIPAMPTLPAGVAPALVVYGVTSTGPQGATSATVYARPEDGSGAERALSRPGVISRAVAVLGAGRVLVAEFDVADTRIERLVSVDARGRGAPLVLASFDASAAYSWVRHVERVGDDLLAELLPIGGVGVPSVVALRAGAAARVLVVSGIVVAADAGRALVLAGAHALAGEGDLALLDVATGALTPVGGGDGKDAVVAVEGAQVVANTRAGVRVVAIGAGTSRALGAAADRAVGVTSGRVVATRPEPSGTSLVSSALDGQGERTLVAARGDLGQVATAAGDVVVYSSDAGLSAVAASGGASTVVDRDVTGAFSLFARAGDRVVYTAPSTMRTALRTARLDGGGATTVFEKTLLLPVPLSVQGDRILFRNALLTEPDEGWLISAKLDGTEQHDVAWRVQTAAGQRAGAPTDQDYFGITPSGTLVAEVEYEGGLLWGSQLVVSSPASDVALELSGLGRVRFAGIVP